jgi:hypothetical protein
MFSSSVALYSCFSSQSMESAFVWWSASECSCSPRFAVACQCFGRPDEQGLFIAADRQQKSCFFNHPIFEGKKQKLIPQASLPAASTCEDRDIGTLFELCNCPLTYQERDMEKIFSPSHKSQGKSCKRTSGSKMSWQNFVHWSNWSKFGEDNKNLVWEPRKRHRAS